MVWGVEAEEEEEVIMGVFRGVDQRGILSFFFDIKNEEEVKLESPSFQNEAPENLV